MHVRIAKFIARRLYYLLILKRKKIVMRQNVLYNLATKFGGYNKIQKNVNICSSTIGIGTYLSEGCILANTKIGNFCSIAPYVKVVLGKHPTNIFVSTHPAFFSTQKQAGFSFVSENIFSESESKSFNNGFRVEIGNDVWIGYGVHILEGVKIGNGAIIGACSLITKDIEPYTVNVGIPAKQINKRFTENDISFLENTQWWNWSMSKLKSTKRYFSDIELFKKRINEDF
jgi:acetyltransferase-like isoleucine patch superfamily enzyme